MKQDDVFSKRSCFFLSIDGELYVATTADFSGTDPLIYREGVRTEQYDLKHLNGEIFSVFSAFHFRFFPSASSLVTDSSVSKCPSWTPDLTRENVCF